MLLNIMRYIFGYVKVEVFGFAPERFMNLVIKNDIVIWDVKTTECGYIFYTGKKNLMKIKAYLHKTNMKIRILNKYGIPFVIKRNRKRVTFFAGFGMFLFIIYIMSLFVWEVTIVGEDKLVADNMLELIEREYVPLGTLKSQIDCNNLEDSLRNEYNDISWISCELKGTGLTIYLEEGMITTKKEENQSSGDIVAIKDAVITKMITREGTPIAKVKDSVQKGDILISGTIYIYDDNNEVIETSYIAADGDVYGTTTFLYEDYVDLQYYEKMYAEESTSYITIYFLKYCFTPYIPDKPKTNYDVYTEIHKMRIFDNFYLPFGYKTTNWTPYTLERKKHNEEEAEKILNGRLQKKIKALEEKGVEIIENNVKIEQDNNKIFATGNLILNEPIVTFKKNTMIQKNKDVK